MPTDNWYNPDQVRQYKQARMKLGMVKIEGAMVELWSEGYQ